MFDLISRRARGATLFAACLAAWALPAFAHERSIELAEYGSFEAAAPCQEAISRATRQCFEAASRAHYRCANIKLHGGECSVDLAPIISRTTAIIEEGCHHQDDEDILPFAVGYTSMNEAKADLTAACEQQSEAMISLLYGPTMFSGDVEPGPAERDRCVRVVARYGYKIARTALRERAKAFVAMGRAPAEPRMEESAKLELLAQAEARIDRVRSRALELIEGKCSMAEFTGSYGMTMGEFSDLATGRGDCVVQRSHVVDAVTCPAEECGNGVKEPSEVCDDGNTDDGDACGSDCQPTDCKSYASTYDLIQDAVFEDKGCTDSLCHGSDFPAGNLDLRAPQSYDNLVGAASLASPLKRVVKSGTELSFLYHKLAAATLGRTGVPGSPMPQGLPPLSPDELEAVRLWIYAGAPRTGVVEETGDKLDACLPPADPIQVDPPEPPPSNEGTQLVMPPLEIMPGQENEVCIASYYDLTAGLPDDVTTVAGTFRYKQKVETQDPLSHHLIIHTYLGDHGPNSGVCRGGAKDGDACDSTVAGACGAESVCENHWGEWTCKGGVSPGQPCNPLDPDACGRDSVCGGTPERSVACIGYGPPDYNATTAPAFGGSQQPLAVSNWLDGVYSQIPAKGIIVWNSHHFNLTQRPAQVRAWVNFDFARPAESLYPVQGGILDPDNRIFIMNVPPYDRRRYCHQFTFPQGARVFEISSHMHKRGKLFQIYKLSQDNPVDGELIYNSTQYNDPVALTFDDPIALDSPSASDRTYRYCAEYDNGKTNPAEVKLESKSPPSPPPFPPGFTCNPTHCADPAGLVPGPPCTGGTQAAKDASCAAVIPGSTCDACTLTGGVTTEHEMFLFLSYYYCDPGFPDTCKDEYGFLGGGGGSAGRQIFVDSVGME